MTSKMTTETNSVAPAAVIDFAVSEVVRFGSMPFEDLRPHLKENGLYALEGIDGHRHIVGRAASNRLYQATEDALRLSPLFRRVDSQDAYKAVKKGLGQDYLNEDYKTPSDAEAAAAFQRWIATLSDRCVPRTQFVPCAIRMKNGGTVQIGPVTITGRKTAWPKLAPKLDELAESDDKFGEQDVQAVQSYFEAFPDVAEVAVSACDAPTSQAVAEEAVQAAIDFIHIVAGAAHTRRMRSSGPAIAADKRSWLCIEPTGALSIGWSVSWDGASLGDTWWEGFNETRGLAMATAAGVAISTITDRSEPELLAGRFLDASAWYGDAARERSNAAAVVKYLTSMERLLWAGEKGPGVTDRIAKRAAALCFSTELWDLEDLERDVRLAYDVRSAILHGRISKSDPLIPRNLRLCERVARDLLLTWLDRYGHGFRKPVTLDELKVHLDGFVEDVARAHKERSAESTS